MRFIWTLLLLISLSSFAQNRRQFQCGHRHSAGSNALAKGLNDNLRSDTIDILHYQLYLDFSQVGTQQLSGVATVQFSPKMNGVTTLSLDLLQLDVDSVTQNNNPVTYSYNDTLLIITLDTPLNNTDTSAVTVYYNGSPQQDPSGWGGFYFQGDYAYNLGVGFGSDPHNYGRVWHPCFDNFSERATYVFEVLTTQGKTSYCNGYIDQEIVQGDTLIRTWRLDETIPSYLASVAVGNLTHAELMHTSALTGNVIPMWLISPPSDTTNFKNAFTHLDEAIDIFEGSYGKHEWNKVGYVAVPFSSGAMEHATNIAYPQSVLASGTQSETLMAHEFAHHWWGDLVTCETEAEMWINEGMASYSEHLFLDQLYDYETYLNEVKSNHLNVLLNAHINDQGHYALSNVPHEFTYGDHSYKKGADVMHNLRGYMGDAHFFQGLKSIIQNYPFQTINSTQFRDEITNNTLFDATDFFDNWILNPGFPQFSIDSFSVVPNGTDYDVTVYTKQRLRAAPNFYSNVPLDVSFMSDNWEHFQTEIIVSGQNDVATVTIPFDPSIAFLNENNRINMASTANEQVFKFPTNLNFDYSLCKPYITTLNDSIFLRITQHWAAPDDFINPNGINAQYTLSKNRFWSVTGLFGTGFTGRIRFHYKGHTPNNLDSESFDDSNTPYTFDENSLRVMYRPGAGHEWTEVPNITVQTAGNTTDGFGYITSEELKIGDYCLAWISGPVGLKEHQASNISIYPNPTEDLLWVDLRESEISPHEIRVYDLSGKLLQKQQTNATFEVIDLSSLNGGTYLVSVLKDGKFILSKQIIVR